MKVRIMVSEGKGEARDGYDFSVTMPDAWYLEVREVLDPAATTLMSLFNQARHEPQPRREHPRIVKP